MRFLIKHGNNIVKHYVYVICRFMELVQYPKTLTFKQFVTLEWQQLVPLRAIVTSLCSAPDGAKTLKYKIIIDNLSTLFYYFVYRYLA